MEKDAPEQLTFERSFYVGGQITLVLYGIHLCLFSASNYIMLKGPGGVKEAKFYIAYGSALLILWTIALACNAVFGQYVWIDHRDEGGPAVYLFAHIADWYNTWGTAAGISMNFLADALLLYRCYIIWASSWPVVAFPIVLYLGAMSMAILLIYESAQPGANFFKDRAVGFGVPYVSMTISLNTIVTLLIVGRLVFLRNKVRTVLGPKHGKMYTSVASIMIESAAPFTILGIGYVITYARDSPVSFAFVQVWGDFCAISPQLIILRVAMGQAWTKDTVGRVSTGLTFEEPSGEPKSESDGPMSPTEGMSTTQYASTAVKSRADSSIV